MRQQSRNTVDFRPQTKENDTQNVDEEAVGGDVVDDEGELMVDAVFVVEFELSSLDSDEDEEGESCEAEQAGWKDVH
jgi:hypothetical protein